MYAIDCEEDGRLVTYIPCMGQGIEEVIEMAKVHKGKLRRWADGGACLNPSSDIVLVDYSTK